MRSTTARPALAGDAQDVQSLLWQDQEPLLPTPEHSGFDGAVFQIAAIHQLRQLAQ
jgi:hypothetical protein